MRVAKKHCSQARPALCLRYAALRYRVSFQLIRRIAWCESGLNPYAYNGAPNNRQPVQTSKSSGLMQFMPPTFAGTPYHGHSIWSARYNALAGAWLLSRAGTGPWVSSQGCWAR